MPAVTIPHTPTTRIVLKLTWYPDYQYCRHTFVMYTKDESCKTPDSPGCKTTRKTGEARGYCPNCQPKPKSTSEHAPLSGSKSDVKRAKAEKARKRTSTSSSSGSKTKALFNALFVSPMKPRASAASKGSTPARRRHNEVSPTRKSHKHSHKSPGKRRSSTPKAPRVEEPRDGLISESDSDDEFPPGTRVYRINTEAAYERFIRPLEEAAGAGDSDDEDDDDPIEGPAPKDDADGDGDGAAGAQPAPAGAVSA